MTQDSDSWQPRRSASFNKLEKRLTRQVGQAIADYGMIEAGDRVLVCCSGGKDSYTLLTILMDLAKRAPVNFELVAMNLDQGQPGFPKDVLPRHLETLGLPYRIVTQDTYSIVKEKVPEGKTTCALCSRLRRGLIYRTAQEMGATKIALGHHLDDAIETLFLNLFFGAKLKAMPPKLRSDDGQHLVIRPLTYCLESDIARYATAKAYNIIPCDLCGSQPNLQRQAIKAMLTEWERRFPGRKQAIFHALQDVRPSQLADRSLFDFAGLRLDTHEAQTEPETPFADPLFSAREASQLFATL